MSALDRTAPERQRRLRQRQRDGLCVVAVEVAYRDLEMALDAGLLTDEETLEREALSRAMSRIVHEFMSRVTTGTRQYAR